MAKKVLLILTGLIIVITIAVTIYAYTIYKKVVVKANKSNNIVSVSPTATPTPDPLRSYSILLMGYGGGNHQGGYLTDSIIVAKIDPKQKQVNLISLPRDLWVSIPINQEEEKNFKLNHAYAIGMDDTKYPTKKAQFTGKAGGGELSKYVISKVLGFNIDYFVTLDFQGFVKTVDILGGITVPIKNTFDDYMYPIEKNIDDTCGKSEEDVKALTATMSGDKLEQQFTCRYEHLHFDAGPQNMNGETALKFVRSRHSKEDGGDFNRAARQQLVINSVKEKVLKIGFVPKIIPFINTLSNNMRTDIDFSKMQEFVDKSSELSQYKIKSVALTDQNVLMQSKSTDGQFILVPKEGINQWTQIQQFINDTSVSTPSSTTR